jgi:hypothetical protein
MGVAANTRCHRKTLFPLRKEARFQEVSGRLQAVDSRQAHFLYQAVLQGLEQPLDASLGLGTLCRNRGDPQFLEGSSELRAGRFALQLFGDRCRADRAEDAVFISVMGLWPPEAPQPSLQGSQVLFGGVVLGKTYPDATGSVVEQSD